MNKKVGIIFEMEIPLQSQVTETVLERKLQNMIKKYLSSFIEIISQYIPVKKYPRICVVSPHGNLVVYGKPLPVWVRALTIKDCVYIIAYRKRWNDGDFKNILCHELFHATLYLYFGSGKLIPYWFNESIAYLIIMREFKYSVANISLKNHDETQKVVTLPKNIHSKDLFTVISRVSEYLLEHSEPKEIKKTMRLAKQENDFDKALSTILDLNVLFSKKKLK